jgi:hypothetical protein
VLGWSLWAARNPSGCTDVRRCMRCRNMTDVLAVLETPALLVDLEMLEEANLAEMAAIAGSRASS